MVKETRATYRRRRLGALLVVAILTSALYAGSNAGAEAPPTYHTVAPGDTLWEITAEHYSSSEDPRPIIEDIREMNEITDYQVHPGMRLELPAPE
jgi:LysM repeat protein